MKIKVMKFQDRLGTAIRKGAFQQENVRFVVLRTGPKKSKNPNAVRT